MKTNLMFGALALMAAANANADALVVAKDSPIPSIDVEQARNIFLGRQTSVNGHAVTLVFQDGGPVRDKFEQDIVGMSGAGYTSYLYKSIFTGRMKPPAVVTNDAAVKAKVNATPGTVGYISTNAVDGTVKVLLKY
jgi:hypothetical protein